MARILVATDLSPRADRAVARAFRLARENESHVTVATITDDAMPDRLVTLMSAETKAHLETLCDDLSVDRKPAFDIEIRKGDPSGEIPAIASEVDPDLIVLGQHRRRQYFDSIRETTLERVIHLCSVPVLVVLNRPETDYSSILAAIDFSPASTAALFTAHRVAPKAKVQGIHVTSPPLGALEAAGANAEVFQNLAQAATDARDQWMAETQLPADMTPPKIATGALEQEFQSEIARVSPDLISIGAHARLSLTHRMLGSFARQLVADPPADIVIAKPASG